MAARHGKNAALTVNSQVMTTFCDSIDMTFDVDTAGSDTFGATWKSEVAGLTGGKVDITGTYDPTATTGPAATFFACISGGVPVTALYYPGGNLTGQALWTITSGLLVKSYSESSKVGDVVKFKASAAIVVLPVRSVV